jgi:hypothetical protein
MGAYGVVISGWVVQVVIGANSEALVAAASRLTSPSIEAAEQLATA